MSLASSLSLYLIVSLTAAAIAVVGDDEKSPEGARKTFKSRQEAVSAMNEREPKAPKAGDPAPDFTLCSADGKRTERLSTYKGVAPVVLIFGSYT